MRVLVTGAAGFVGQAVCRRLVAEGWEVFGAIRRPAPLPEGVTSRLIETIGPHTHWEVALAGIDAVVHLAARVHVMRDQTPDPLAEFRRTNTEGSLRLATEAARLGVHRFVFMSSIKVNGEASGPRPFHPEDQPAPADPYGQSKTEAEHGLAAIAGATGLKLTILRPPLVYGPGVGGNFRSLLKLVERGWPLPLGGIDNRRSLIYVDNLADAVCACLNEPAGTCETFLVGDGLDVSTPDLIRRIARAMGRPARLLDIAPLWLRLVGTLLGRRGLIQRLTGSLQVDDHAFRARFGWTPPISLDEGLRRTVEAFRRG